MRKIINGKSANYLTLLTASSPAVYFWQNSLYLYTFASGVSTVAGKLGTAALARMAI